MLVTSLSMIGSVFFAACALSIVIAASIKDEVEGMVWWLVMVVATVFGVMSLVLVHYWIGYLVHFHQ